MRLPGAEVGEELRRRVRLEIGVTCSCGVAPNRMLAKAMHLLLVCLTTQHFLDANGLAHERNNLSYVGMPAAQTSALARPPGCTSDDRLIVEGSSDKSWVIRSEVTYFCTSNQQAKMRLHIAI